MKVHRTLSFALLTAAASALTIAPAHASPSMMGGGYTIGDFPTGDWGKIAGFGLGIDGATIVHKKENKPISLRTNLGLLYNFSRTQDVPQSNLGPNSALALQTKNTTLFFGVGPEFSKPMSATPFIFGTAGFNTYWTVSNLSGTAGGSPYSAKFGDSRIAFAWSAGLGVRKKAVGGMLTELSVEYRSGGGHMYLLPGEVTNTGTTVNTDRKARDTNQIILRLGTVIGGEPSSKK